MKKNIIIEGKINSGKTKEKVFPLVNEIIKNEESFLVLDSKLEYIENYKELLEKEGYNTYVIDLRKPQNSTIGYNPLLLPYELVKSGNTSKAIDYLKKIGEEFFYPTSNNDPFWDNTSIDLFVSLALLLFKEEKKENINLKNIFKKLYEIENNKKETIKEKLNNLDVLDPIYLLGSTTFFAPAETRGSIISVFKCKLNSVVIKDDLNELLSISNNVIKDFKKKAIFIVGKDEGGKENIIARIIINQILGILYEKEINFNVILDNFDSINYENYLRDVFSSSIARGISIVIVTRNIKGFNQKTIECFEKKI